MRISIVVATSYKAYRKRAHTYTYRVGGTLQLVPPHSRGWVDLYLLSLASPSVSLFPIFLSVSSLSISLPLSHSTTIRTHSRSSPPRSAFLWSRGSGIYTYMHFTRFSLSAVCWSLFPFLYIRAPSSRREASARGISPLSQPVFITYVSPSLASARRVLMEI